MKKMIFFILSLFIISNVGFSKIYDVNGITFDDRSFGEKQHCNTIGVIYLGYSSYIAQDFLGIKDKEFLETIVSSFLKANEILRREGWNENNSYLENIDLYYKSKCSKVRKKDFVNNDSNNFYNDLILVYFFNNMKDLGMLID